MRTALRFAAALPWLAVAAAALLGLASWRLGRPGAAHTTAVPTLEERVWRAEHGLPAASEPHLRQSSGR